MEIKNIILIVIAILVIALVCFGAYIYMNDNNQNPLDMLNQTNATNATNATVNNTTDVIMIDDNNTVGDNSPRNASSDNQNNSTYRVYNPQSDSYVTVVGEGYDDEVDRWYTYDTDGVRYYNTRIK